jgi:Restriction endonuclease S subunits
MKSELKRYERYKDSRLGDVPEGWEVKRIKDIVKKIGNGVTPLGGSEVYTDFGIPFLRSQNVYDNGLWLDKVSFITEEIHNSMKNSQLKVKDILINITGASIGRTCIVPPDLGDANINQHIAYLRIKPCYDAFYISRFLTSPFIKNYIQFEQNGASKEAFNLSQIGNIPLVLPLSNELQGITAYLDAKTNRIDRKIELLTAKVDRYRELKQALINETVTRGLDPTVPMKDSGVEWIGVVPAHWEVKRLKELFVESKGRSLTGEETLLSVSEYTGVTKKTDNIEEGESLSRAESLEGYKICKIDDLVINIMLAWKRGLGVSVYSGIVSPSYAVYSPLKNTNAKYFHYLLRNNSTIAEFKRNSTGIIESRLRLYTDSFYAMSVAVPSFTEQQAIATYLDTKTTQIDQIITTITTQIQTLQELRKTLINDVVTGKIKVV